VILKWAESQHLVPLRLPFHFGGEGEAPQPKKEAEYGEDFKFVSTDGKTLYVFVLKAKKLTYSGWTSHDFDKDMRLAVGQDLSLPGHTKVEEVKVILCYNKGEDHRGVEAYTRFEKSAGTKVGDHALLTFERWNLTTLANKVQESLAESPSLLPDRFFRSFSYICWQVGDFPHGSDHWESILTPDWRQFLGDVLSGDVGEAEIRMVSIALIVVKSHGLDDPSWETGWIELLEWAVIALWRAASKSDDLATANHVFPIWANVYLTELHTYYERHSELLVIEDSLAAGASANFSEMVSSQRAYWHMGRLGILTSSLAQLAEITGEDAPELKAELTEKFRSALKIWAGMIGANPSVLRPLLDIHHIELYLFWSVFYQSGKADYVVEVFRLLVERLILRRAGLGGIRLIDQGNSWSDLLDHVASSDKTEESMGKSSYLLQMLLEICIGSLGTEGEYIAQRIHRDLILGIDKDGESYNFSEQVELQSWAPPEDWQTRVLESFCGNQGVAISIHSFLDPGDNDTGKLVERVKGFIKQSREQLPLNYSKKIKVPAGVMYLSCILHKSPLPPELWRCRFPESEDGKENALNS